MADYESEARTRHWDRDAPRFELQQHVPHKINMDSRIELVSQRSKQLKLIRETYRRTDYECSLPLDKSYEKAKTHR